MATIFSGLKEGSMLTITFAPFGQDAPPVSVSVPVFAQGTGFIGGQFGGGLPCPETLTTNEVRTTAEKPTTKSLIRIFRNPLEE
ncbi:MAG: hypothetical protein ICV60_20690 [Pyrinomonadaceae bacterium]|nr:hypothetical protein [Pyrinomonadaceae bacterium]